MAVNVVITRHACKRARERIGIPARAVHRAVQRAWSAGRVVIDAKTYDPVSVCRVYGEFLFVFIRSGDGEMTCVTVLCVNQDRKEKADRKSSQSRLPGRTLSLTEQGLAP